VAPLAASFLPFSTDIMMGIVGAVEFAVGVTILALWPVAGAYVASAWLLLVAVNLVLAGYFDVAVRDVVMSVAAFTLAGLLEAREHADARDARPLQPARHGVVA
jgi:hypothetical protein